MVKERDALITLMGKRVLVTGAGGFIGSHLVEELAGLGAQVRALVRYNSRSNEGLLSFLPPEVRENVEVVYGDVRQLESVRQAVRGVSVVFHLAALVGIPYSYLHPQEVIDTNVIGTANILLSAREEETERVVLTSTSEVYGTARYVPIDEKHPLQAQSPYSATKIAADALGISFLRSFGLPVTLVRPFNTYGPRQSARAVIPTIITQALTRDETMLGALTPTRDFTFVTDIVKAFIGAAKSTRCIGEVINIGSGFEIAIGDLAKKVVSLIDREVEIKQDEKRLRPPLSEVERLCADSSKAKELLGWEPEVSLDEGLRRTIEWFSKALELYQPQRYRV